MVYLSHKCESEAQEGGLLLEGAEGVSFVLQGLGDAHELDALAGQGAHVATTEPDGVARKPAHQKTDGDGLQVVQYLVVCLPPMRVHIILSL